MAFTSPSLMLQFEEAVVCYCMTTAGADAKLRTFTVDASCLLSGNNRTCNVTGQVKVCAALHICQPSCCITAVIFHREQSRFPAKTSYLVVVVFEGEASHLKV